MCTLQLLSNKWIQSFQYVRDKEVALLIVNVKDSLSEAVNLRHLFATLNKDVVGFRHEGHSKVVELQVGFLKR